MNGLIFLTKQESEKSKRRRAEGKAYDELNANSDNYSSEYLFDQGKKLIENEFYCVAELSFYIAYKRGYKKELSETYHDLSCVLAENTFQRKDKTNFNKMLYHYKRCMKDTLILHSSEKISRDETLDIERWINRVDLNNIVVDKKSNFYRINELFRKYIAEKFFDK